MRNTKRNKKQNGQKKKQKKPARVRNRKKPKQAAPENERVDSGARYAENHGFIYYEALIEASETLIQERFKRSEVVSEINSIEKKQKGKAALDESRLEMLKKELEKSNVARKYRDPEKKKKAKNKGVNLSDPHQFTLYRQPAGGPVRQWQELRAKCLSGTWECYARRLPEYAFAQDRLKILGADLQLFNPIIERDEFEKIYGKDICDCDFVLQGPNKNFLYDLRFVRVASREESEIPLTISNYLSAFEKSADGNLELLLKEKPRHLVSRFQKWFRFNYPSLEPEEDNSVRRAIYKKYRPKS